MMFTISTDVDYVVRVDNKRGMALGTTKVVKDLLPACTMIHQSLLRDGIADLQIPGHKLNPKSQALETTLSLDWFSWFSLCSTMNPPQVTEGKATPLAFRYDFSPDRKGIFFTPTPIAEDRLSETAPAVLKHAEAGALFHSLDQMDKVSQMRYSKLIWELQVDPAPPPTAQILKPKLWFLRHAFLKPGFAYRLK